MSDVQLTIYHDADRCIKCYACQVTCKQWHGFKAGDVSRRKVYEEQGGSFPNVTRTFHADACHHCDDPECVKNCPAQAITKREEDGIVVVDQDACIGCQTCASACPFGVPEYEVETGKMNKCDMCLSLGVGDDGRPAPHCVATCPMQALYFGTPDEVQAISDEKDAAITAAS